MCVDLGGLQKWEPQAEIALEVYRLPSSREHPSSPGDDTDSGNVVQWFPSCTLSAGPSVLVVAGSRLTDPAQFRWWQAALQPPPLSFGGGRQHTTASPQFLVVVAGSTPTTPQFRGWQAAAQPLPLIFLGRWAAPQPPPPAPNFGAGGQHTTTTRCPPGPRSGLHRSPLPQGRWRPVRSRAHRGRGFEPRRGRPGWHRDEGYVLPRSLRGEARGDPTGMPAGAGPAHMCGRPAHAHCRRRMSRRGAGAIGHLGAAPHGAGSAAAGPRGGSSPPPPPRHPARPGAGCLPLPRSAQSIPPPLLHLS